MLLGKSWVPFFGFLVLLIIEFRNRFGRKFEDSHISFWEKKQQGGQAETQQLAGEERRRKGIGRESFIFWGRVLSGWHALACRSANNHAIKRRMGVLQRRNERAQKNMLRILARREMSRSHGRGSIPKWLHGEAVSGRMNECIISLREQVFLPSSSGLRWMNQLSEGWSPGQLAIGPVELTPM